MFRVRLTGPLTRTAAAAALLALGAAAQAIPMTWTDTWNPPGKEKLNANNKRYSFTHDITDQGYRPGVDQVLSARIKLDLSDDTGRRYEYESGKIVFSGRTVRQFARHVRDFKFKVIGTALFSLSRTGLLDVKVKRTSGDFYFNKSTLRVKGVHDEAIAVTEPGSLGLLGAGLLGLMSAVGKRRRRDG